MKRRTIRLHIEELVLHGFNAADRHQISDALERELTRLLAEGEWPGGAQPDVALAALDAGEFSVEEPRAGQLGRQVAQALGASVVGSLGGKAPEVAMNGRAG